MSLSIAERQAQSQLAKQNNSANKALVANNFVILENLDALYVNAHARTPKQLNIIDSLHDFYVANNHFTSKQYELAASIILQNANFFKKSAEPESEADDSDAEGDTEFPE